MKVTIELTDMLLDTIAEEKALERSYDVAHESENSADRFYAIAFYEGASFILEQLKRNKDDDTSNS